MMLLDQNLKSIRVGPTTRALPFLAPREPDPQGLGKGSSWFESQDWGVLSRFQTSSLPRSGLIKNSQRGCRSVVETNFPQGFSSASSAGRLLTPQEFPLSPAHSERVPQSPALVRVVRVDPALLAGLPLSADPPYLPTSSGHRSARTKRATASSRYACCRWTGCHTPRRPKMFEAYHLIVGPWGDE